MITTAAAERLADDGINPARALILQAYWALRREHPPANIGSREITGWIRSFEPYEPVPSQALIQLTLEHAGVARRAPGRPANASKLPPFCPSGHSKREYRKKRSPT